MSRSVLRLTLIALALLLPGGRGEAAPALHQHVSVMGDFDGDGLPDRVVVVHDGLKVALSHIHPRQLYFRTSGDVVRLALCDVDRDGDLDLLALRRTGQLLLYRNQQGRLTPVAAGPRSRRFAPAPARLAGPNGQNEAWPLAIASRVGGGSGGLPAATSLHPDLTPARLLAPAPVFARSPLTSRRGSPRAPPRAAAA